MYTSPVNYERFSDGNLCFFLLPRFMQSLILLYSSKSFDREDEKSLLLSLLFTGALNRNTIAMSAKVMLQLTKLLVLTVERYFITSGDGFSVIQVLPEDG